MDQEKNRLRVELAGDGHRKFNLGLIDIREKNQKIPELNFPVSIEVDSIIFNEAVEDMAIIADSVILTALKDKFSIESSSHVSDAKVDIHKTEENSISFEGDEAGVQSKYSVDYLKKIIKGSKLCDKVRLKFGKDYPLEINYSVMDRLQLTTILAPRVSND